MRGPQSTLEEALDRRVAPRAGLSETLLTPVRCVRPNMLVAPEGSAARERPGRGAKWLVCCFREGAPVAMRSGLAPRPEPSLSRRGSAMERSVLLLRCSERCR